MKNAIYLSLIIPVYNVANYIVDCMSSIASQELENCQVLFVDDGSKDESVHVIEHYLQNHPQFNWQIVHKPNGGLSSARNYGLRFAQGEYVWFIDSDDMLAESAVHLLKTMIQKRPVDTVIFGYQRFIDIPKSEHFENVSSEVQSGKNFLADIFSRRRESYAWSFITKRSLYLNGAVRFPEGRNYEDMATTYQIAYFSQTVVSTDQRLYLYRDRKGSISNHVSSQYANDLFANLSDCQHFFLQHPSSSYSENFGDFAAYYALLAYQQNFTKQMYQKLLSVFKQLDLCKLNRRYQVAYLLARMRLLRAVQMIRTRLNHSWD
ncbi:glycosyltransferase [Lacticaseibacillus paracasei subsp. paracasei Lpp225]|uniref:Glycosyltransferase n=1 Tax=Lacticaseibacillus paracasei subsp. paracasei Lpp225 TaxID=1256225 RepID=S2NX49_LACPA|nr:glycosyltransferase [Lacticaseibacillus paracasei subsp. paracasei Lpp225]